MRKQAYIAAGLFIALTLVSVSTASAQSTGAQQFTAEIPFAFHVGNKSFPAGEYIVRCLNPSSDMKVLQLRSSEGNSTVLIQTSSVIGRKNRERQTRVQPLWEPVLLRAGVAGFGKHRHAGGKVATGKGDSQRDGATGVRTQTRDGCVEEQTLTKPENISTQKVGELAAS